VCSTARLDDINAVLQRLRDGAVDGRVVLDMQQAA
jgi:D-arabinose 1-dehydrogenase-like Zn-dependent alcohol dehydrogenase